ncbi:MAG: hypothetical protein IKG61_10630 [Selenomonadaceae bacterium]|nr:hypothetical protein [Selenomonadaceae bacterium]
MLYTLTSSFTRLSETTGTIQNSSSHSIEVSNQEIFGTGVVIKPGETFSFSNASLFARCEGAKAVVRVVPFVLGAGGSGGSSSSGTPDYTGDVEDMWTDSGDPTQEMWDNPTDEPYDDEFDKVIDHIYGFDTP